MAELLYEADFQNGSLAPTTDTRQVGSLQLTQAPVMPGTPEDKVDFLDLPGLRFRLERKPASPSLPDPNAKPPPQQEDNCYVGAVVSPLPPDITSFKIQATFDLPEWQSIEDVDFGWAMAVFARKGNVEFWPTRAQRTTGTLQSFRRDSVLVSARMNTPGGTAIGAEPPVSQGAVENSLIPEELRHAIFESGDPARSRFRLELLIDSATGMARVGLYKSLSDGKLYSARRWFTHPLISNYPKGPIESVGFAIGIARGVGVASAKIRNFRIETLSPIEVILALIWASISTIAKWLNLN